MVHVENAHLAAETAYNMAATAWAMHLVVRWRGGEPLDTRAQRRMADYLTASGDTGVLKADLDANEDIPYIYLHLDIETIPSDDTTTPDITALSLEDAQKTSRETACAKGLVASLGGLSAAGVPLELLQLEATHLVREDQLEDDRQQKQNPHLFVEDEAYCCDELAHSVFYDEVERYQDLVALSNPTE